MEDNSRITAELFCDVYGRMHGVKINSIMQLTYLTFTGTELMQFMNDFNELLNKEQEQQRSVANTPNSSNADGNINQSSNRYTDEEIEKMGNDYALTQVWIDTERTSDMTEHEMLFQEHISKESFIAGFKAAIKKDEPDLVAKDDYEPSKIHPQPSEPVASHTCTSSNSIEHLLKPRYKVIAEYPHSPWLVGEILFVDSKGELVGKTIGYVDYIYQIMESEVSKFSKCFQKLEWWEEREPEEMPEYVSYISLSRKEKLYGDTKTSNDNFFKARVFVSFGGVDKINSFYGRTVLPATKEEYEESLLNTNHQQ